MSFYGMSRKDVFELPIQTFWFMNRQIDRIEAEKSKNLISDYIAVQSQNNLESREAVLNRTIGVIYVEPPVFERDKMRDVAAKFGALMGG